MSKRWTLVMAAMVAMSAPAVLGESTSTHAVGPDGSVYYTVRAQGTVIRVAPDGSSEVVADTLDSPTGVLFNSDGSLLVIDEVGMHQLDLEQGTIQVLSTEPTPYEPSVRFQQGAWTYNTKRNRVTIVFSHNLSGQNARFDIEVSRNGGLTWKRVASDLKEPGFVWQGEGWPIAMARFRVTARVGGQRICSDVSNWYEAPR